MKTDSERLATIEANVAFLVQAEMDKEKRLRQLERRDAYVLGAAGILTFVVPLLAKKFLGI